MLLTIHFYNFGASLSRICGSSVIGARRRKKKKSVPPAEVDRLPRTGCAASRDDSSRSRLEGHLRSLWRARADVRLRRCQVFSDARHSPGSRAERRASATERRHVSGGEVRYWPIGQEDNEAAVTPLA